MLQARLWPPRVGTGMARNSPMTSALEGVSGEQHALATLYPREIPSTHFTGGWVGPMASVERRKISPPPGFNPRTVQPIVSHYTELPGPQFPQNTTGKC